MSKRDNISKKMYSKCFNDLCEDRKRVVLTMLKLKNFNKEEKSDFAKIPKASFNFCRYSMAILVWLSFIFRIKWLLIIVLIVMAWSAIFTIKKAPLTSLYSYTIGKFIKSENEFLNIGAMRFAHSLCSIMSALCLIFLYFGNEMIGWGLLGLFAIIKTISAIGLCPASKLYTCMFSGGGSCCSFSRKINGLTGRKIKC